MTPEELAELHALSFDRAPAPWNADSFRALLVDPSTLLMIGTSCFALARVVADEAELLTLAVHPELRRRGYGISLLLRLETELAERGATMLFCEVSEDNTAARALYAGNGFSEVGRRKGYYRTGHDKRRNALILQKCIGPVRTP